MINFEKVEIIGFGPILGPLVYHFKPGLNIIKADNGKGKTSIFNAWYWGLTGETLKPKCSINMWPHLQPPEYLGTKVTNYFSVGESHYKVIRCNNYQGKVEGAKGNNRILIYENNNLLPFKGVAANKEAVLRILDYSPDLLKNTLVFGQRLKRLIDEPGTNKKAILEEAFDLLFISQAQEKAQASKKNIVEKTIPIANELARRETELEGKRELLSEALDNEKIFENNKEDRILELRKELKEVEREYDLKKSLNTEQDIKDYRREIFKLGKAIKKYQPNIKEYDETYRKRSRLESSQSVIGENISDLKDKLYKAKKDLNKDLKKCPLCKSEIGVKGRKSVKAHLKLEIKELNTKIKELKTKSDNTENEIHTLDESLASLKKIIDKVDRLNIRKQKLEEELKAATFALSQLNQYEKSIEKLKGKIKAEENKKLKKRSVRIKLKIRELKAKIKPLKTQHKNLRRELDLLEWLIKDPLSNSGLKAYIFRDMIYKLNDRMAYYSKYFGFKVEFEVDMDSARKDINAFITHKGDNIIPYEDLSGGQAQSVAVVIAFALHDIVVKGTKKSNVLIMDEIFENLDRNNIEKVTDIINSKGSKISLNLITHRNEFNPYNGNIIKLAYKDGITSLIN